MMLEFLKKRLGTGALLNTDMNQEEQELVALLMLVPKEDFLAVLTEFMRLHDLALDKNPPVIDAKLPIR